MSSSLLLFLWISTLLTAFNAQEYYPYDNQNIIIPIRQCYLDYDCPYPNSECGWLDRQHVCKCLRGYRWNGQQCQFGNHQDNHHNDGCWNDWTFSNCTPLMTIAIISLFIIVIVAFFTIVTCIIVSCTKR